MEVEAEITKKVKVNIKYLIADLGVRYFEDCQINGAMSDDNINPQVPCVITNNGDYGFVSKRWRIKIDIDEGRILNWNGKTEAVTYYKVCDDGHYEVYDSDNNLINVFNGYVPDILGQDDKSFGDYVCLTINKDGYIKNWTVTKEQLEYLVTKKDKAR